jgi:tyrosyl-tRNA synthetase
METNILERLLANVAIMEPRAGLQDKLAVAARESRPLTIKLGFDPTAPDLQLGHAVVLQKLRDFQDAGHRIVVVIGDFTARIGDPTGRNKLRPPLSAEEIEANSATYINQLGEVVDVGRIEVRRNSKWLAGLAFEQVIKLVSFVTVAQIMQRDDFKRRFETDMPIHLHELLYPILQGYDSVMIDADIELGGTDQLFNNLMGRALQEEAHGKPGPETGTDGSRPRARAAAAAPRPVPVAPVAPRPLYFDHARDEPVRAPTADSRGWGPTEHEEGRGRERSSRPCPGDAAVDREAPQVSA